MKGVKAAKKLREFAGLAFLFLVASSVTSHAGTEETSQLILQANNLSCRDCHRTITYGLQHLDQNIQLISNYKKKTLIISYPDSVKDKEIIMTLQKLGYRAGFTPRFLGGEVVHTRNNGPVTYGYCTSTCSASANTWKEFYRRYFAKKK